MRTFEKNCKFSNKNDLLSVWKDFKKNLYGIYNYPKWNFKLQISSIFHFVLVNNGCFSHILCVKKRKWCQSYPQGWILFIHSLYTHLMLFTAWISHELVFYEPSIHSIICCTLWQYRLWSFQAGGTKLERFLPKNQYTPWKLLNFENWVTLEFRI